MHRVKPQDVVISLCVREYTPGQIKVNMNTNTPQSGRRLSTERSSRTSIACNRCRRRKQKCLGRAPFPCMMCDQVGAECTYPDQLKRRYVTERELDDLRARAEAAESSNASNAATLSPPTESVDNDEDRWWWDNREILVLTRSGEHQWVGSSHSTYLATQLTPMSRGSVAFDVSPLNHDNLCLRRDPNPHLALPPFDTARRWYAVQFAYIGSIFCFIQPKYFEDRLAEVYSRSPDTTNREDCLLYCQILLILAFGQMYSLNEWAGNDGPPGFSYFQAALKLLPDIHEEGSVLFVEVLGLTAYYMQILNRRDAAFLYIGLAVRMAVSLGLHQEVTNSTMDAIELEHRRRIWWSAYSMDRILCVKSGNPISIHDEDIDAAFPSYLLELDLNEDQPKILSHYTKLSQTLGRIGEEIYRRRHRSGTTLLTSMQQIMTQLEMRLKELPACLRLDFNTFHHHIPREAVSTFLHYTMCVSMTGRPLLFRVCQKRLEALAAGTATTTWQEGLSHNIVHVVSNSIAAARTATSVMEAASKHNLLATYGFMDGEHAFSAALVLLMANVAFPHNDRDASSMAQAFSVLKGMAQKGNEYIKARHALLVNLSTTLRKQAHRDEGSEAGLSDDIHNPGEHQALTRAEEAPIPRPTFEQFQDLSFELDMDDDDAFWEEFSGQTQIGMDSGWIHNAFTSTYGGEG